jgi:hypothetical protein
MIASAHYQIAQPPTPWPATSDDLPSDLQSGIVHWALQPDGSLHVELNQRQNDGTVVSVKDLLRAAGVADDEIPLIRTTRERLILRQATSPNQQARRVAASRDDSKRTIT